jgi:hypothetical protein
MYVVRELPSVGAGAGHQTPYLGPVHCGADLILELAGTREVDAPVRPCFDVDGGYFATSWRVVCEAGHVILFPKEDGIGYDPEWLKELVARGSDTAAIADKTTTRRGVDAGAG